MKTIKQMSEFIFESLSQTDIDLFNDVVDLVKKKGNYLSDAKAKKRDSHFWQYGDKIEVHEQGPFWTNIKLHKKSIPDEPTGEPLSKVVDLDVAYITKDVPYLEFFTGSIKELQKVRKMIK